MHGWSNGVVSRISRSQLNQGPRDVLGKVVTGLFITCWNLEYHQDVLGPLDGEPLWVCGPERLGVGRTQEISNPLCLGAGRTQEISNPLCLGAG